MNTLFIKSRNKIIDYKSLKINWDNNGVITYTSNELQKWDRIIAGKFEGKKTPFVVQDNENEDFYIFYKTNTDLKDTFQRTIRIELIFRVSDEDKVRYIVTYLNDTKKLDSYIKSLVIMNDRLEGFPFEVNCANVTLKLKPFCNGAFPPKKNQELDIFCSDTGILRKKKSCKKKISFKKYVMIIIILVVLIIGSMIMQRKPIPKEVLQGESGENNSSEEVEMNIGTCKVNTSFLLKNNDTCILFYEAQKNIQK